MSIDAVAIPGGSNREIPDVHARHSESGNCVLQAADGPQMVPKYTLQPAGLQCGHCSDSWRKRLATGIFGVARVLLLCLDGFVRVLWIRSVCIALCLKSGHDGLTWRSFDVLLRLLGNWLVCW